MQRSNHFASLFLGMVSFIALNDVLAVRHRGFDVWLEAPSATDPDSGSFLFNFTQMHRNRSIFDASIVVYHPELGSSADLYNLSISSMISNSLTSIRTVNITFNPTQLEQHSSGTVRLDIENELNHLKINNFHSLIFMRIIGLSNGQALGNFPQYSMMAICSSRYRHSNGNRNSFNNAPSSSHIISGGRLIRTGEEENSGNCLANQTSCCLKQLQFSDRYDGDHNTHALSVFGAIFFEPSSLKFLTCAGSCNTVTPESEAYSRLDFNHMHTQLSRYLGHDSMRCVATQFVNIEFMYRDTRGSIRPGRLVNASASDCKCIVKQTI